MDLNFAISMPMPRNAPVSPRPSPSTNRGPKHDCIVAPSAATIQGWRVVGTMIPVTNSNRVAGVYLVGVLLWLAYGVRLSAQAVIWANTTAAILVLIAIVMKALHSSHTAHAQDADAYPAPKRSHPWNAASRN